MPAAIAETVLVDWLTAAFPAARVVTETPANLAEVLPCIRVTRFGGADEQFTAFDNPTMDFDCYAATREAARNLAYAVRDSIRSDLPGQVVGNGFVARTETISGPAWLAYDNTSLRRFTYSARIRLHSI